MRSGRLHFRLGAQSGPLRATLAGYAFMLFPEQVAGAQVSESSFPRPEG